MQNTAQNRLEPWKRGDPYRDQYGSMNTAMMGHLQRHLQWSSHLEVFSPGNAVVSVPGRRRRSRSRWSARWIRDQVVLSMLMEACHLPMGQKWGYHERAGAPQPRCTGWVRCTERCTLWMFCGGRVDVAGNACHGGGSFSIPRFCEHPV